MLYEQMTGELGVWDYRRPWWWVEGIIVMGVDTRLFIRRSSYG